MRPLPFILAATAIALAVSLAYAHVIAFYPMKITITPSPPAVIFEGGSNANVTDVAAGQTASVIIGANKTSLEISIHPSYQTTYYENISLIINTDTNNAHTVNLTVINPANLPAGSVATLYIFEQGTPRRITYNSTTGIFEPSAIPVAKINLTDTNSIQFIAEKGAKYEVDILIYIPEGTTLASPSEVVVALSPVSS